MLFHLKQSVKRWCTDNKLSKEDQFLIQGLIGKLYSSPTRIVFTRNCRDTKLKIVPISPIFWEYFDKNYLHLGCKFPPELWAAFSHIDNINRTNNIVESKNRNIKLRIGTGLKEINFIVLAKEYSLHQPQIFASQKNKTWESILIKECNDNNKNSNSSSNSNNNNNNNNIEKDSHENNIKENNKNKNTEKDNFNNEENKNKNKKKKQRSTRSIDLSSSTSDINNNNSKNLNKEPEKSEKKRPSLGQRIEAYFPDVFLWYRGTLVSPNDILYDDGELRRVDNWSILRWRKAKKIDHYPKGIVEPKKIKH